MVRRLIARLVMRLIAPELREAIRRQSVAAVADAERRGGIVFAHRDCYHDGYQPRRPSRDAQAAYSASRRHPEAP